MTTQELVDFLNSRTGFNKLQVRLLLTELSEILVRMSAAGDRVKVKNLGVFSLGVRRESDGERKFRLKFRGYLMTRKRIEEAVRGNTDWNMFVR